MTPTTKARGAIAWMAKNHVTANLLMIAFIFGGFLMTTRIKQEVFPDLELDFVSVTVPYPGASPEEVEKGIILAIEESIQGLDGIKRVSSVAREGLGIIFVELLLGANPNKSLSDIKNAVDRIRTFPEESERPIVSLLENKRHVISLMIYGDQSESVLRDLAEKVRNDLLKLDGITQVELSGVRRPEIAIEIPQQTLRAYNLTLNQVARRIDEAALELPAGRVKTKGGEILVRTTERRYWARQYGDLPIITRNDGTVVTLSDIAVMKETFEETDVSATFNDKPAVKINVFRVGDETPTEVSDTVKKHLESLSASFPPTMDVAIWQDMSEVLEDRINLLVRNALLGLILVLLLLGLALDIRLAFWVTLGIPISILGAMLFMPLLGVSINMISLFAIIVTIGIVVDDAVIIGENIYHHRRQGKDYLEAAIDGARQMAVPVTFSILTNIAAFMPLMFVPGVTGKIFKVIPLVVIVVFLVSLVEALFILPAHLSHRPKRENAGIIGALNRRTRWFENFIIRVREKVYRPSLEVMLKWRYSTLGLSFLVLLVVMGFVISGRIDFSFMPKIESDRLTAAAQLSFGSPVEETRKVRQRLLDAARETIAENGGDSIVRGIYTKVGAPPDAGGMVNVGTSLSGAHLTSVSVYFVPIDKRQITADKFVREWRRRVGHITGLETLSFKFTAGPSSNKPVNLLISHTDTKTLEKAAADLADSLKNYAGVRDIDDGFTGGKAQLDFKMKPSAQSLGISASYLAQQVRASFYGAEALRNQRGRDEVKLLVRLPENERRSEFNIEELMIRAPNGTEIPISEAAEVRRGRSYTEISRMDGRRVLNVTADVETGVANAGKVVESVMENEVPGLMEKYPGLKFELDGEERDKKEAMDSLVFGFIIALFAIFTLLAIPFKSYSQPVLIMMSIPFGIIGAVIGHVIMGYELSLMSMFGIIALSGVVVNDSLILIDAANHHRWQGSNHFNSIVRAGVRRFRPILLTSVTTFLGLAPMIFETSIQARFMVPMALSLGYGILFATGIALVIIPCLYLVLIDVKKLFGFKVSDIEPGASEAVDLR